MICFSGEICSGILEFLTFFAAYVHMNICMTRMLFHRRSPVPWRKLNAPFSAFAAVTVSAQIQSGCLRTRSLQ